VGTNPASGELHQRQTDSTTVILTAPQPACHAAIVQNDQKSAKRARAPRIRVPNSERALFTVDTVRFVGVIQRLSLSGGSAVLAKGPIPHGTMGDMTLNTVFGKVEAKIEFLQTGADGVPLAQAFRFLTMDDTSSDRFAAAAKQMEKEGFSDAAEEKPTGSAGAQSLNRLLHNVRRLAATLVAARSPAAKR
jgi:hypothetical protein